MTELKFSIITVCRNAEKTIENALLSAFSQTYPHIEYIIIDGASTDQTLAIVKKYRSKIAQVISEPDRGIYDAMNKGIKAATGDILYFLNSDDRLYDSTILDRVAREFASDPKTDILYGKVFYTDIPAKVRLSPHQKSFEYHYQIDFVTHNNPQQCYFIRRDVFDKVGVFNPKYKISADYDWLLRCWRRHISMKYLDNFFAFYCLPGISYRTRYRSIPERIRAVRDNSPWPYFIFYLFYASARKFKDIIVEEIILKLTAPAKQISEHA